MTNRRTGVVRRAVALIAVLVAASCDSSSPSSPSMPTAPLAPTTTSSTATTPTGTELPPYAAGLQAELAQLVEQTTAPAAIVVVRSPRFGDATFTFGAAERGGTEPVTTQDHIRAGSVTKTMTATIILQLVQEGLLALDDPVSDYVPDVPGGDEITIGQLMNMRSGLFNYTDDAGWAQAADAEPKRVWTPQELLDIAFAHPANFEPGTNWKYTNTNYVLLGLIMEELTGQPARELFEQRLFAPLGMDNTVLPDLDDDSLPSPFLHGYHYGSFDQALPPDEQAQAAAGTLLPEDVTDINPSWAWTAGSVTSTVDDLVIWVDALVSGTLLDAAMQQVRMDSIQGIGPDYPQAEGVYGYGYGIDRLGTYYGHGGQINGFNSAMSRDPDTETTVIAVGTLTLAPDGTPVAPTLSNAVISALDDDAAAAPTLPEPPGDLLPDD